MSSPSRSWCSVLGVPVAGHSADWLWFGARILFAANWAFNAVPGKYTPTWYRSEFVHRVGYFAYGNPWSLPHSVLSTVVLTHPALFAALSAVGETAAALFLLFAITTRLGGAVALAIELHISRVKGAP